MRWISGAEFREKFGYHKSTRAAGGAKRDKTLKGGNFRRMDVIKDDWWRKIWAAPLHVWVSIPTRVKLFTSIPKGGFTARRKGFDGLYDNSVPTETRKKFIKALREEINPITAARAEGKTLKELMMDDAVRHEVEKLIRENTFAPEVRRKLQRALVNKGALDAARKEDFKALANFTKQMGEDPEVGIVGRSGPQGSVTVNVLPQLEEMKAFAMQELADAKPVDLKMLEAGTEQAALPHGAGPVEVLPPEVEEKMRGTRDV